MSERTSVLSSTVARCRRLFHNQARTPARTRRPALETLEDRTTPAVVSILDNGSTGYSTTGSWTHSATQGYLGDVDASASGIGADAATWSFSVPAGTYRVAATWTAGANRASNAPFSVFSGTTLLGTATVNQKTAPADFSDAGTKWRSLGLFATSATTLNVKLTDQANGTVIADAVRIERLSPATTIGVEPATNGYVEYEALAPKTVNDKPTGLLALRMDYKNVGTAQIHVNKLLVSFIGTPSVSSKTYPLDITLKAGQTAEYNFRHDNGVDNRIFLPSPAPAKISLKLYADGYAQPFILVMPLQAHVSPVAGGSYLFPASASDLRIGEVWSGSSNHDTGYQASQIFGYDLGVSAYDTATHQWSTLLPGTDNSKNSDSRIWGKPVRAMADGTVLEAVNDVPSNPHPLHWNSTDQLNAELKEQQDKYWGSYKNGGAGNHLYIQHGNEVVLYAHMQPGSIPAALQHVGAHVTAGMLLGLAGNAGNSTGPHLHIHAIKGTAPESGPLRPFSFHGMYVADMNTVQPPNPAGPWVKVQNQAIPSVASAIWPAATAPAWYPPGYAELAKNGVSSAAFQTEFSKIASSHYRMVSIDGYNVGNNIFYNMIFRPDDGKAWTARAGMTGAQYQAEFTLRTGQGYRLTNVDSYPSGGNVYYAAIFTKVSGPAWTASNGLTATQFQTQFNTLTAQGYHPVNISAVALSSGRFYTTLYEKSDVGAFVALPGLTVAQYQTQFTANANAGRQLAYLNAYSDNGSPRIIAIWTHKAPIPVAKHGLTSSQYQAQYNLELSAGLLTRGVTGYDVGGTAYFAAFWTK